MQLVDALSRHPISVLLVDEESSNLIAKIEKAQQEDPDSKKIVEAVLKGSAKNFFLRYNVLYKESSGYSLLVVPKLMQYDIIRQAHEQGHLDCRKTEYLIRKDFWFQNMKTKIQNFIENCVKCILADRNQGKGEGFLQLIDKGCFPLDTYHLDYLGPIPSTKKNYKHIFVVVDAFAKFVWLYPTTSTTSDEVRRGHTDYCKDQGIEHI